MIFILLDLDGTIMLSGGAGKRAMEKIFFKKFGVPDGFTGIIPDGKTDPEIFREMMEKWGVKVKSGEQGKILEELKDGYVELLRHEVPRSTRAVIMPGVRKLISELKKRPNVKLGLLTGNYEEGAKIKLSKFGLNGFFEFGAFGSDAETRNELVEIAIKRAEKIYGKKINLGKNVVIIGDTPRDVACADAFGLTCIAVATGRYSTDELERAGADYVFTDLSDTDRVLKVIDALDDGEV